MPLPARTTANDLMSDLTAPHASANLATLAAAIIGVPCAAVVLDHDLTLPANRSSGIGDEQRVAALALCRQLIEASDDGAIVRLTHLPGGALPDGFEDLRSGIALRLPVEPGEQGGAICLVDTWERPPLSVEQRRLLEAVARLAVEQDRAQRRTAELEMLHAQALRASRMLRSAMEADNISDALTELVAELCRHHRATVGRIWKLSLPDGQMQEISRFEADDLGADSYYRRSSMTQVTTRNSFTASVIESNEPRWMLYSNVADPNRFAILNAAITSGLKCQVSYPIWVENERFGIAMSFTTERSDLPEILADIGSLADTIRPALYRKVAQERLQLLSVAMDATNDAVLITEAFDAACDAARPGSEPGPRILYANPSFYRMTGYTPPEIIGRSPRLLQGPETDRAVAHQLGQRLRQGQPARAELENYRKDGTRFWVELEITPIEDQRGRITNLVSVQRDVTARRMDQQIMLQSEKLKTIGQLTGGVAHDFNNLLTVVTLNLEMALGGMAADDPSQELLETAMRAAGRGVDLTQQLLSYARRSWLRPRALPLTELFDTLQPLLKRTLSPQFTLNFDAAMPADETPIAAMVDPGQLDNALLNLVINARDAMPKGGPILLVARAAYLQTVADGLRDDMKPGRYVRIEVRDKGTGIPPDVISRVFDPFFTTKEIGKGTGLGLSMVYGFAKQTGGTAFVSSKPGEGTTVTLFLPVSTVEAGRDEAGVLVAAEGGN